MSMKAFQSAVSAIMAKANIKGNVMFVHDADKGLFRAYCPMNVRITGNAASKKLTVRWGSGHQAMISI